jgi:DNA polymerase III delta prime subunit
MSLEQKHEYPVHLLRYLINLAGDKVCAPFILMDEYVFSTYFTALLQGMPRDFGNDKLSPILRRVLPGLDTDEFDPENALSALEKQEKLMQIVNNLRSQFSENITTTYVKDFFISSAIYREITRCYKSSQESCDALNTIVNSMYDEMEASYSNRISSITVNLERLSDTIALTEAECKLLELNLMFSTDIRATIFRDFLFTITKNPTLFEHFYKVMLGENDITILGIDEALSERSAPIALGIVNYDIKSKRMSNMSEFWVYAISNYTDTDTKFFARFVDELKDSTKTFSNSIAKANAQDEELLQEFLSRAYDIAQYPTKDEDPNGLNMMLYGTARIDKKGYVINLLKKMNLKGMAVRTRDAKAHDIPSICYVAQQRVKALSDDTSDPIILIVEKTEQALTKSRRTPSWMLDMFGDDGLTSAKEDLDSDELLLMRNPVPTIWLVATPSAITPENVGRFLFHVELKGGSRADRREEVKGVVDTLGFNADVAMKLSKYVEINVEQVKSAARAVQMLMREGEEGEKSLFHLIGNSQKALDREKMEELRDSVTKYSLDYLNLAGGMPIDKIITALKRKMSGTLCLYGAPGTGKTQLAEFIALELDKPLLIKPASALLNMYLGETEKNIAAMFDEAKSEGAILLLDEADSFLRDRSMASKSWEVTQVNELLQRMERFQGLFICATNLMTSLDAAALRRFTFKLEFKALTNEQRLSMFINESKCNYEAFTEREDLKIELATIKHLTPGDFATVRRQANLLDEQLDVETWLDRLDMESKAKLIGLERNGMGFVTGNEVAKK